MLCSACPPPLFNFYKGDFQSAVLLGAVKKREMKASLNENRFMALWHKSCPFPVCIVTLYAQWNRGAELAVWPCDPDFIFLTKTARSWLQHNWTVERINTERLKFYKLLSDCLSPFTVHIAHKYKDLGTGPFVDLVFFHSIEVFAL